MPIYHKPTAAGDYVEVTAEEYYRSRPAVPRPGLGDAVAAIATPIARALGLSCIDPATRQLRPDSPCARRKAALNRINLPAPIRLER